jgi:hypothetical protein
LLAANNGCSVGIMIVIRRACCMLSAKACNFVVRGFQSRCVRFRSVQWMIRDVVPHFKNAADPAGAKKVVASSAGYIPNYTPR